MAELSPAVLPMKKNKSRTPAPPFSTADGFEPTPELMEKLPWRVIERTKQNQLLRDYRTRQIPGWQAGDKLPIDGVIHHVLEVIWDVSGGDCIAVLTVTPSPVLFHLPRKKEASA